MSAYSARPSRSGSASKLPMQPLSLGARPEREERVFQVTNKGLAKELISCWRENCARFIHILLIVREVGRDRFVASKRTI